MQKPCLWSSKSPAWNRATEAWLRCLGQIHLHDVIIDEWQNFVRLRMKLVFCFQSSLGPPPLHRLMVDPSRRAFFLSTGRLLTECFILSGLLASPCLSAVLFLADDAVVACRAILPECFTRSDWADLCSQDPSLARSHPEACRAAAIESGEPRQGR